METYCPNLPVSTMSREEVRAFDAWAIRVLQIPGIVLMENAGRACAELIMGRIAPVPQPRVCILCGPGNNGGDGYVIARHLLNEGVDVGILRCGDRSKVAGDALTNLVILENRCLPIETLDPRSAEREVRLREVTRGACLIVGAIFGSGLRGPLDSDWSGLIEAINDLGIPTLAVDIPSGLDCNTGEPLGAAIRACWTVSFVAVKQGYVHARAWPYTGAIHVASIGVCPPQREEWKSPPHPGSDP